MAFMTSFRDIWENQSLSRVPSLASDFGMYAYYVPWCIGEGTRDEGIYLVLSSKPIEDATKINIRELALKLGEFPCMNTEIMMIPLDAECKTDKSKAESIVNTAMDVCKSHKILEDIFARYGDGTKMPKYISYIDETNLRQAYSISCRALRPHQNSSILWLAFGSSYCCFHGSRSKYFCSFHGLCSFPRCSKSTLSCLHFCHRGTRDYRSSR